MRNFTRKNFRNKKRTPRTNERFCEGKTLITKKKFKNSSQSMVFFLGEEKTQDRGEKTLDGRKNIIGEKKNIYSIIDNLKNLIFIYNLRKELIILF